MNEDNTPNFGVMTWLEFTWNDKEPYLVLGIGGEKRTKTNILRTKEFSANLVTTNILKLADYFGNTKGNERKKTTLKYECKKGKELDVPILEESKWVFECKVKNEIELKGSKIFISKIKNIQIDERLKDMNREMIDLKELDPVLYAPYNYYSIKERLGGCGEWEKM
jgi:flavin reductase (DIM6/NTAB) family NADH-FMN oxidoreductase RutF